MKASEIKKVLDEIAPPDLAYKGDELGFIVGNGEKEVKVVGITERPTVAVLEEAVNKKVELLVIHEPLYHSEKSVVIEKSHLTFPPNKKRKLLVEKGGLTVFRYHSQWDEVDGGNNDTLAELLEIGVTEKIPYGRIGRVNEISLKDFAESVKQKLGRDRVLMVGDSDQKVNKVAVIAGSGNSLAEMMELVKQRGIDVVVSGDITDGRARYAKEIGLAVIDAGDYYTENPGAKRLTEILEKKLPALKIYFLDPGEPWVTI